MLPTGVLVFGGFSLPNFEVMGYYILFSFFFFKSALIRVIKDFTLWIMFWHIKCQLQCFGLKSCSEVRNGYSRYSS
jgi:hypothetical protein